MVENFQETCEKCSKPIYFQQMELQNGITIPFLKVGQIAIT